VYAYRSLGIVCEASAAVALAGLLEDKLPVQGRRVVVLISGGNIESALLDQVLVGLSPKRLDG
jgi:threonine dehydratase